MTQLFFIAGGLCYVGMAVCLALDGKPWMAATFVFYALSVGTLYMGGTG